MCDAEMRMPFRRETDLPAVRCVMWGRIARIALYAPPAHGGYPGCLACHDSSDGMYHGPMWLVCALFTWKKHMDLLSFGFSF